MIPGGEEQQENPMKVDVVIVGGGVIGSAIAYFLSAHPGFDGSVLVVERDMTYTDGSTARSAGSIRQQFSTPENIAISQYGVAFLQQLDRHLAVEGEVPHISFVAGGYLFLASEKGRRNLQSNYNTQCEEGVQVSWLERGGLSERFPWLNVDDLSAGCIGERDEGWFDPYALLQGFKRKAQQHGVVYQQDTVAGIGRSGARVDSIDLASGTTVSCGYIINAAGPRAARVAEMAKLKVPVFPRKRYVYVFDCRTPIPECPLVVDPSGCYFRPEGSSFICGLSPPPDEDPDCLDLEVDFDYFDERIWPLLAHRVPAFEAIKRTRAWAGHYAYNTFDQNAILGPHPEVGNFLFANGFSGHGLQQAPAVGRAISEWLIYGESRSLDLRRLMYDRLAENRPILELNVV